jgi:uncharacterized RmlC-like cupin family protein
MKTILFAACLVSMAALAALRVVPGATLFENDQVKAVRALEKAHVKGKAHEHKVNRVMVYLQSGKQRFEYQDGRKPQVFDWKAGQVVWSAPEGFHSPEVVSDEPFNIVEVELKTAGGKAVSTPLDPVKIDPGHYKVEFENEQVRVLRVKIGGHEAAPLHEHALNRVTVYLTDQNFRVTAKDGKVDSVQHKAGDTAWGTPVTHREENLSDQPFEAVVVEIKG